MIPTTLHITLTTPAYQISQAQQAQDDAGTEHRPYTWKREGASHRLVEGIHPGPGATAILLLPHGLPATIQMPSLPGEADKPTSRPPCTCPNWDTTLHAAEFACPSFGGVSAHCAECGGCKACRVLQICGRYRPSTQRAKTALSGDPVTHPPIWTESASTPASHHAVHTLPDGLVLCLIQPTGTMSWWKALVVQISDTNQAASTVLGTYSHLSQAKDHVADWLDSLNDGPVGTAQATS